MSSVAKVFANRGSAAAIRNSGLVSRAPSQARLDMTNTCGRLWVCGTLGGPSQRTVFVGARRSGQCLGRARIISRCLQCDTASRMYTPRFPCPRKASRLFSLRAIPFLHGCRATPSQMSAFLHKRVGPARYSVVPGWHCHTSNMGRTQHLDQGNWTVAWSVLGG